MVDFFNHLKNYFLVQVCISLFFRVFFFFLNGFDQIEWLLKGAIFDILFCICLYGILSPLSFLVFKLSKWASKLFQAMVLVLVFFVQYATEIFYHTQNNLLGKSVLFYSIDDLFTIANTSESNTGVVVSAIAFSIIISAGVLFLLNKIRFKKIKLMLIVFFGIAVSQFVLSNIFFGNNEGIENGVVNKSAYFLNTIISEITSTPDTTLTGKFSFRETFQGRQYSNDDYPLSFRSDPKESKISPFFSKSNTPPDLVFIIVESLSRVISGQNSTHASLTPFLDSLAENSLVWDNCVSSSERTFGVLPGVLGSLPYGKHGLLYMGGNMPQHISLVNILEKNGYTSNFYYGGNAGFDNTDIFLNRERFDNIQSSDYITKNDLVYWGLTDSIVFDKSLKNYNSTSPQLHTYLTLSTHGPFDYERRDALKSYLKDTYIPNTNDPQLIEWSEETLDLLTSFYYVDQQVKHLINKIEQTGNYENTIFIITGDHGLPFGKNEHPLKNYHVPLIIHSPLIKEPKRFGSLVSHLDITPSLQKMLNSNFNIQVPSVQHFIGQDLDTNAHFISDRHIPLMSGNKEVEVYIKDSLVFYKNELHKLSHNLNDFAPYDDEQELEEIKNELASFQVLNSFVCEKDRLISNEDSKNWITHYELKQTGSIKIEQSAAEYVNIFKNDAVDKEGYIKIEVDLSFPDSTFNLDTYPRLVLAVMNGAEVVSYTIKNVFEAADELLPGNLNKTVAIEAYIPAPENALPAHSMKVYLWNSHKVMIPLEEVNFEFFEEL